MADDWQGAAERAYVYRPDLVPDDFPAAEIFGYPPEADTDAARDARARCACPFKGGACTKLLSAAKTGVCSVRYKAAGFESSVIWATCANRLKGAPFQHALERHFGADVDKADLVTEVRLKDPDMSFDGVGILVSADESVEFIGIEAQTIDTRGGKILPIFESYVEGTPDEWRSRFIARPAFGVNTTNVWKRLLPQVMNKGRMFADWDSKLFVILQDSLLQFIRRRMPLKQLPRQEWDRAEIVWLPWDYTGGIDADSGRRLTEIGEPVFTTLAQVEEAFVTIHAAQRPAMIETVLAKLGKDNRKAEAVLRKAAEQAREAKERLQADIIETEE
ncbi:MAG: NotI family restriction endonuclease [Gemmatimonadaceae bacterium]